MPLKNNKMTLLKKKKSAKVDFNYFTQNIMLISEALSNYDVFMFIFNKLNFKIIKFKFKNNGTKLRLFKEV